MQKKVVKFSVLPALLALIFFSFTKKKEVAERTLPQLSMQAPALTVPVNGDHLLTVDTTWFPTPVLQKNYTGFKAALAFQESQGFYHKVNAFGYLGKYQFSRNTLAMIGVHNISKFMNSPQLQEEALYTYLSRNKWVLKRQLKNFVGKTIDDVKITESGMLAAAHLAGPGGVKSFLRSGGTQGATDAFGSSIKHYMKQFGGYDLSFIKVNRYAKL